MDVYRWRFCFCYVDVRRLWKNYSVTFWYFLPRNEMLLVGGQVQPYTTEFQRTIVKSWSVQIPFVRCLSPFDYTRTSLIRQGLCTRSKGGAQKQLAVFWLGTYKDAFRPAAIIYTRKIWVIKKWSSSFFFFHRDEWSLAPGASPRRWYRGGAETMGENAKTRL